MKKIIPCLYLKGGKLVKGFNNDEIVCDDPVAYSSKINAKGADGILIFDLSDDDDSHEESLLTIRKICNNIECEIIGAGNVKRLEDVKKLLYAGCSKAVLNLSKESNVKLIEEAGKRFGKNCVFTCADIESQIMDNIENLRKNTSGVIMLGNPFPLSYNELPTLVVDNVIDYDKTVEILKDSGIYGVSGDFINNNSDNISALKNNLFNDGIDIEHLVSPYEWDDFKKNSDGHLTVVVQDIKTDTVLMVAYMNKEAYEKTISTGIMTYYSRSRNELWIKGETSGHYQYVKSLYADCDMDTLVAKVVQIGNACHTGSYSCFFNEIMNKKYDFVNPYHVFEDVYDVIIDRKNNPKEGSYTNYLFDKGIDKILKKVGEEATEIVIAAKNPEKEEVKYEIADFLYHVMVLMAECDLTWEDITKELANR